MPLHLTKMILNIFLAGLEADLQVDQGQVTGHQQEVPKQEVELLLMAKKLVVSDKVVISLAVVPLEEAAAIMEDVELLLIVEMLHRHQVVAAI